MTSSIPIEVVNKILEHFDINITNSQISLVHFHRCVCHNVYQIKTPDKKYFLKKLNPIMLQNSKELVFHNNSQKIAFHNYKNCINTVLAYRDSMCKSVYFLDNNYYMLYPWIDVEKKKIEQYLPNDYFQIGALLGKIHSNSSLYKATSCFRIPHYDTLTYDDFKIAFTELGIRKIIKIYQKALDSFASSKNNTLSHCDITPSNILWKYNKAIIVDWDAAGWVNQEREIQQTLFSFVSKDADDKQLEIVKQILIGYLSILNYHCSDFDSAFFSSLLEDFESIKYSITEKFNTDYYSKKNIKLMTKDLLRHLALYDIIKKAFLELSII